MTVSATHITATGLPETRRAVLDYLKLQGEARAEAIAEAAEITCSGARQHLVALERDGLVVHREVREGPGRPKHLYRLSTAGDDLFPRNYAGLTNELLHYLEGEDPNMLTRIFDRRGQRRLAQAQQRLAGKSLSDQVRAIAGFLDDEGYLAEFGELENGTFLITEHNCAVLSVATQFRHACNTELAFLQAALPDAEVERVAHQVVTGHVCAYQVSPRA